MTVHINLEGRCGECLLFGAIEGLEDALVLVDPGGRIFHVNRTASELLGIAAGRVQGKRLREHLGDPRLARFWTSALRDGAPATTEMELPAGRPLRVTVAICRSREGEPIGRALLLRDITHEKRVQVELSASVARRLVDLAGGDETTEALADLTRRELQVLRLLAGGLSNAAMAARLRVSKNTVASHLKHLYPKIGVHSRSQAAAFALAHGLRPPRR